MPRHSLGLTGFVSKQVPEYSLLRTRTAPDTTRLSFDGQTHCYCCNYSGALGDAAGASASFCPAANGSDAGDPYSLRSVQVAAIYNLTEHEGDAECAA